MSRSDPRLSCTGCANLFVTHDKHRPWGCRAFGFKSPYLPGQVVMTTSGTKCANYSQRKMRVARPNHADKGILA
jgi:hypothetical protein